MSGRAALVYLHGFASGPGSKKAAFFRERLAALGVPVEIPDLNQGPGGFEGLTVTRMIAATRAAMGEAPSVVLFGSSLGGYVSALVAAREPERVAAIVLLAPAFDFPRRIAGAGLHAALAADGRAYEGFPDVRSPALVLHGARDESVPIELSRRFAAGRPNVRLIELDDDHMLHASMPRLWEESRAFLAPWCRFG